MDFDQYRWPNEHPPQQLNPIMTKKSQARLERDAVDKQKTDYMQSNKLWDEISATAQEMAEAYAGTVSQFYSTYVTGDLCNFILPEDISRFELLVKSLKQGMEQFSKDFARIRKTHENKTGPVTNTEEMAVALNIHSEYAALYSLQFGAQNNELQELAQIAGKAIQNRTDNQSARDPEVVTDVQVKEAPKD